MARLPIPGSDDGTWGDILNEYLKVSHDNDGSIKNGAVDTSALQNNSVSGAKLQDDTVTPTKLSTGNTPASGQLLSYNGSEFEWITGTGGAVDSVNSQTGAVTLDADDIDDSTTTHKFTSAADISKLAGIEAGAEANTVDSVAGKTGAVTLDKTDVGLTNVDNTSDANKPISTATQAALDDKADLIVTNDLANDVSDLQTNKADINYRYWSGTGGVGAWDDRPSVPAGRHVDAYSVLDALAPAPPDAVEGDVWFRHPDAV